MICIRTIVINKNKSTYPSIKLKDVRPRAHLSSTIPRILSKQNKVQSDKENCLGDKNL